MYNIIVNSSHVVQNSLNNNYNYQFKQGSVEIPENCECMITAASIPYSFYNITQKYNNNQFKFYYPTGTNTYTAFTIIIPDGFYTQSTFSSYLQQWSIDNKLYMVDASGNNFYFFSYAANTTLYANQLILRVVPTVAPAGFTTPVGFPGFPTVARTCYIEILALSTSNFSKYIGLTPATYPAVPVSQTTTYNVSSNIIPLTTTVNNLVIKCSLVNNGTSNASDILDSFNIGSSPQTTFGSNLNFQNSIEKFVNISSGRFNNISITIVDQNLNDITILDPNILISILIRKKKI